MNKGLKTEDKREQEIRSIAFKLLNASSYNEAIIDSRFLFCFDPVWCRRVNEIRSMIWNKKQNLEKLDFLHQQTWQEANQTAKIQGELQRLAHSYHLIPTEYEKSEFAPKVVQDQLFRIIDHVIEGKIIPFFLWPMTQLIESHSGKGVKRVICPYKLEDGSKRKSRRKPISRQVRIRTWSIYSLTKRGGGTRMERVAVDLWNKWFPQFSIANPKNFRKERKSLFEKGIDKKSRI